MSKFKLFGHPIHPAAAHFPMALLPISLLWDLLGLLRGEALWWQLSFWNLSVGLIFAVIAVMTGLLEYLGIQANKAVEDAALRHMMIISAAVGAYVGSWFFRFDVLELSGPRLAGALGLSLLGLILLLVGGWHGGELVYRHGVGKRRDGE